MNTEQLEWMKGHNEAWRLANVEIERLNKELELSRVPWIKVFDAGVVEGERRAMERARLAFWNNIKEIPLGEHASTYNSAIKIFVSMFGQHPKELGLGGNKVSSTGGSSVPPSGEEEKR